MDVQSFPTYFARLRDRNRSVIESWVTRMGLYEEDTVSLEVSSIVPLEELTVDDVLYALVAAAVFTEISHLTLYVFPSTCPDPDSVITRLEKELRRLHFLPYAFDWKFDDETGDKALVMSVFSEDEAYRIHDLYQFRMH